MMVAAVNSLAFGNNPHSMDWSGAVTYARQYLLPSAFIQETKIGIRKALLSFPEPLRQDMFRNGYRVIVGPTIRACYASALSETGKRLSDLALERFKNQDTQDPKSFFQDLDSLFSDRPSDLVYKKLRRYSDPSAMTLEDYRYIFKRRLCKEDSNRAHMLEQDAFKLDGILEEDYLGSVSGPHYNAELRAIILPEQEMAHLPFQKGAKTIEYIVRHESWHFIDRVLGTQKVGQPFSQLPQFQNRIKQQDHPEAVRQKLWISDPQQLLPAGWTNILAATGLVAQNHYFPNTAADKDPVGYKEAFAEVGASLHGGGMLKADLVRTIYEKARNWLQEEPTFRSMTFPDKS